MKGHSVKTVITLWLLVLMILLSGGIVGFLLSISRQVAEQSALEQMIQTVRENARFVRLEQGRAQVEEDFQFSRSGVVTMIYNKEHALLAGQPPMGLSLEAPFENGTARVVDTRQGRYLLLDLWLPSGWEEGLWLRGLSEAPEGGRTTQHLLKAAALVLPVLILLGAGGGYWIVGRALAPLDAINETVLSISEGKDLSRRIALPPGRDEFSRLAENFDRLFARLERSFETEQQFTADASHELRTPISVIQGACELALRYEETPEERRESLEMIHRQALNMSRLVSQLLSMTRLDQGTEQVQLRSLDLAQLVEHALEERDYEPGRVLIQLEEGTVVQVDPILLSRLVQNLTDNAVKYGKPGGHVWITQEKREGELLLHVRDDGVGIEAEHQDRIWTRFYQVDPSRGEQSGSGLGLSMVEQIARLHGGSMSLESKPGEGSCFTLHLPLPEQEKLKKNMADFMLSL